MVILSHGTVVSVFPVGLLVLVKSVMSCVEWR